ncbi:MAG TPA: hypothetical protein VD978_26710 [Azospirillum sp.]|nr:hypothetical protein [Azospirillum sp.]
MAYLRQVKPVENPVKKSEFRMPLPPSWGPPVGSVPRNVTSDPEHGLGKWTDVQIKTAITAGVRADGTRLGPPMAFHYYKNVKDEDLDALTAYLRALPPQKGRARRARRSRRTAWRRCTWCGGRTGPEPGSST